MEQLVKVLTANDDGTAQVMHIRESACSGDCHKCSGCGAAKQTMILTAQNQLGARPGDLVVIRSASGPVLAAAAMLYLVPLALFVGGYLAGEYLWSRGGLTGCLAFVMGIAGTIAYDRLVAKKKNTVYTIIRYKEKRG